MGTIRDAQKWPLRDRRKDPYKIDQINFNLLSPYTIRKMFEGRDLLRKLKTISGAESTAYSYNNMIIKGPALERGINLYQTGINKFLGNSLIKRLEKINFNSNNELQKRLYPISQWERVNGLTLPDLLYQKRLLIYYLDDIESGRIRSVEKITEIIQGNAQIVL